MAPVDKRRFYSPGRIQSNGRWRSGYHGTVTTSDQSGSPSSGSGAQPTHDLRVEFYSRPHALATIRQMIDSLCSRLGFDPAEASRICLAVDEALCNVIRHGYDSDPNGPITLTGTEARDERLLEFIIEDRGRQVDLDTIRSRNLDDVRPGGLGVHLIEEIMDHATWEHRDGGGMRLTLHKCHPKQAKHSTMGHHA